MRGPYRAVTVPEADHVLSRLHAWGACRPVARLDGGNRNVAFLIECGGKRFVAKTTRRSPEAVAWLAQVHAKATEAGIVTPAFLPSRHGHLVVEGVTVETWIEGSPASRTQREGALPLLRAFHQSTWGMPQRPGFGSSLSLIEASRGGDVDLTPMPRALVAQCRHAWSALATEPVSVVHGDLNAHNVLATGGGRLALIDWDEARVDASILDEVALCAERRPEGSSAQRWKDAAVALVAWEVATCWHVEPEYARRRAAELESRFGGRVSERSATEP